MITYQSIQRHDLSVVTMYGGKKEGSIATAQRYLEAPRITPETASGTASTDIVSKDGQSGKKFADRDSDGNTLTEQQTPSVESIIREGVDDYTREREGFAASERFSERDLGFAPFSRESINNIKQRNGVIVSSYDDVLHHIAIALDAENRNVKEESISWGNHRRCEVRNRSRST